MVETRWLQSANFGVHLMAIKNICGAGKMDGYRIKKGHLRHGVDIGCSKNMEYATGWLPKKVTSHQVGYRVE
jgi:hypothetical protein